MTVLLVVLGSMPRRRLSGPPFSLQANLTTVKCGATYEGQTGDYRVTSGIRQRTPQRQTTKADAGQNRDYWPFFQLEQFITYKAQLAGVVVEKVPAAYTTKSCHRCGQLNPRKKHTYHCARCGRHAHADANAAQNIRDWYGWCCPLVLEAPEDGAHDTPPNTVRDCTAHAV